jgi:hypothetical protein
MDSKTFCKGEVCLEYEQNHDMKNIDKKIIIKVILLRSHIEAMQYKLNHEHHF